MKGSLAKFFKKTSKIQRIAIISAVMVMIGAIASVSYIATQAASDDTGMYYTTSDGLWNYVWDCENDYKITIIGYNGTDTDIVFPSKTYIHQHNGTVYSDVKVKFEAIDTYTYNSTFFHNIEPSEVTSITIPSNITEIGDYVFQYCESLTSVTLPDTLTSIGDSAFYYCKSLTSVTLPDTLSKLGEWAFYNCDSLSEINFPSKLTSIPYYAFGCTELQNVVIPYGYTSIGSGAFYDCDQLVNVVIPQSVKKIDSGAFSSCTSLEKAVIPNSVTEFGGGVFQDCTSLKSATLSKNITTIPYSIFYNCTSLTEVKNISNITAIYGYAFYNCTSLTTLDLPDTLTTYIGDSAFQKSAIDPCSLNLKNVSRIDGYAFAETTFSGEFTIPEKVTYLSYNTFRYANVPKLIIPSTVTGLDSSSIREAYIKELVWDNTMNIPYNFMSNNATLEKLTITKDITYIDNCAFQSCTSLKEVNAKNINYLYNYSFRYCTALTTFNAGYIMSVCSSSFYDDTALTTFNAKCTNSIDNSAFYNCTSLTDINDLIENVKTISNYAFQGCSSLGSVKLGSNLVDICGSAFANSGITYLDASNFIGQQGSIGSNAFEGCKNLEEVYNWNGAVMHYLFKDCTALTKITFSPRCYTLINCNYIFSGCSALKDIYWTNPSVPNSIQSYLMYNTSNNIETIHYTVPSSGTDTWLDYYNNYGSNSGYNFVLASLESSTEPTVTSVSIDQTDVTSIAVGESIQLSATITYSDGTTKQATADDVIWRSTIASMATIDKNGKVTGVQTNNNSSSFGIMVASRKANVYDTLSLEVTNNSVGTDLPAKKIKLSELMIDSTTVTAEYNQQQFVDDKPFAMDWGNNGINTNSYSHIRFNVYPANTTDEVKVEITEGSDLVTVAEPTLDWSSSAYSNYVSGITHIADDEGNYNYGTITIKVTAGDAEPLIYTFELEEETKIPNGASFDNSQYQSEYKLEIGKSYDYTAFPTAWYEGTGNPYMWYEVNYSIDDTKLADLSVATVEDAVYDVNNDKYYTARVATITPKKPGTIKLRAHSGRYVNNYTEITLTLIDPDNTVQVERPEESGDPDEVWATSVKFPQDTVTLAVGKTRTLAPVIEPANSTDELIYYSLNKTIATVDSSTGLITAVAAGETTIGVSTSSGLNTTVKVIVIENEVKTTSLTVPETVTMNEGDTVTLTVTRKPDNATDDIVITCDNEDVAKVVDGRIVAVGTGTAKITVTSGDISKTCTVTVNKVATGITLDKESAEIKHGETLQLTATLQPAGVSGEIKWTSSNEEIATVSSTGKVTAVGYGEVEITATVNSKYSAKCSIFVAPNIDFKILGASVRVSDPYGIRFGIQLGKTGDYGDVEIVEYGTVMMPTEKLNGAELTLETSNVLKIKGETIYSETSSAIVYTGVLINIPQSNFGTNISGRGYLIYKDTNGTQHMIYTDTVSRSFTGVSQAAYESYSQIANPTEAQQAILNKLKEILGL